MVIDQNSDYTLKFQFTYTIFFYEITNKTMKHYKIKHTCKMLRWFSDKY